MDLKKTLIIGAAGMVLGGVMVVGGLSAGAETNIAWDKGPKIVNVSILLKSCVAQSGVLRRLVHQTRC